MGQNRQLARLVSTSANPAGIPGARPASPVGTSSRRVDPLIVTIVFTSLALLDSLLLLHGQTNSRLDSLAGTLTSRIDTETSVLREEISVVRQELVAVRQEVAAVSLVQQEMLSVLIGIRGVAEDIEALRTAVEGMAATP